MRFTLALALFGAACGEVVPLIDAAPTTGPLTVHVYIDGSADDGPALPSVGTEVIFASPAGSINEVVLTDANGRATGNVTVGDMVTALSSNSSGNPVLITYLGVKPGDDLHMTDPGEPLPAALGNLTLTMPPTLSGASSYEYDVGCASSTAAAGAVLTIPVTTACATGSTAVTPVVQAKDTSSPAQVVGYNYTRDLAIAGGAGNASYSSWLTDKLIVAVTLNNSPSGVEELQASVTPFVNQVGYDQEYQSRPPPASGPLIFSFDLPRGIYTSASFQVSAGFLGGGLSYAMRGITTVPANLAFDLATDLLPRITSASSSEAGITWTTAGPLTDADACLVSMRYSNVGDVPTPVTWAFYGPATLAQIDVPDLPSSLAALAPSSTSTVNAPTMFFIDAPSLGDWDYLRNHLWDVTLDETPGDYNARFTIFFGGLGKRALAPTAIEGLPRGLQPWAKR